MWGQKSTKELGGGSTKGGVLANKTKHWLQILITREDKYLSRLFAARQSLCFFGPVWTIYTDTIFQKITGFIRLKVVGASRGFLQSYTTSSLGSSQTPTSTGSRNLAMLLLASIPISLTLTYHWCKYNWRLTIARSSACLQLHQIVNSTKANRGWRSSKQGQKKEIKYPPYPTSTYQLLSTKKNRFYPLIASCLQLEPKITTTTTKKRQQFCSAL